MQSGIARVCTHLERLDDGQRSLHADLAEIKQRLV